MRSKTPVLVLLVLAGCHSSSDSDAALPAPARVVNLGLAVHSLFGSGDQWFMDVFEVEHDLDGDGDRTDVVLHTLDLRTGALSNTGLAFFDTRSTMPVVVPALRGLNETLGVLQFSEAQTGRDLDGDGIPGEIGTWILDRRTDLLQNLAFQHQEFRLGGDLAALTSRDASGVRLHVFDGRDGSLTVLPLDAAKPLAIDRATVFFTRNENGALDLNGDGDSADFHVLHRYDADSGRIVNTTFNGGLAVHVQDGFAGFHVFESDQELDLNGDGDRADRAFVALDLASGETRVPGITAAEFVNPSVNLSAESNAFFLTVSETDGDRNGDGDTADSVALFYEPRADRISDTGVALSPNSFVQAGPWIGVVVVEWQQGRDLDRDGETSSGVPHVLDSRTGRSLNLGLRGSWLAALGERLLGVRQAFRGTELVDSELIVWDPSTLRVRRTGLDVRWVLGSSGDRALVVAVEGARDLNGDGDRLDLVLALYEGSTGTLRNLGLAAGGGGLASAEEAVVSVSEAGQGVDLNGDGDRLDLVLHRIFLDRPRE